MKIFVLALLGTLAGLSYASDQRPYEGEELRSIKSLSSLEIESLRYGNGMGFAKLAELNHYPGPRHVLELADELDLTETQTAETKALFDEMQRSAIDLGEKLIAAESALDREFAQGTMSADYLQGALSEIGEIRAQLRYVHLEAHLRQQRLLTGKQISKYDELRGYTGAGHNHEGHSRNHR